MDSAEKRRVNKLLRKPSSLGKALGLRQKLSRNAQKQSKSIPTVSEKPLKQEINVDVATLCAEMCGVSNLSESGATLLQKHLNKIARLLIHEVLRVMEQSRRGVPQASDIDLASVLIGLESPFGTTTANFLPVRTGGRTASSGPGGKVFFIRPDKEIDVKALLLREPAGVVYDVSLVAHWLSVNGKQPTSPQNPPPDFLSKMSLLNNSFGYTKQNGNKRLCLESSDTCLLSNAKQSRTSLHNSQEKLDSTSSSSSHPRKVLAVSVERRPHEISQEVMIYFRELTEACVGANETRRHEALDNATLDPGLQPILPHLMTFITEGVRINVTNHNLAILIYLMRLVKALIDNPHISLEPYLHLLVPTVITCVLNRQLCAKPITDNHWALRDFAAKQLATLCNRHNTPSNELYTRVTRELSRALCSWIDGGTSSSSSETCMKLSNCNLSHEKDEIMKISDDEKLNEMKICKYDSGSTTTATTSTNNNSGPSLGTAVHSMNTLYGILVALAEFGNQCLRVIVLPLLSSLCRRLTKLTEPNISENETNELNMDESGTGSGGDLKSSQQHLALSPSIGGKLSPVDQRSFDSLKVMMTNRIAPVLIDWRMRQGIGITLEDYRLCYQCMADCLFAVNQNPISNPNIAPISTNFNNPIHLSTGSVNVVISSNNSSSNNNSGATVTVNTGVSNPLAGISSSSTFPTCTSSIIVTSNITASNVNTCNN
ncbi:unnamed protein product [Heterobilharzia americana]|nr:unnamed protein product [Heterobilharzia americana]